MCRQITDSNNDYNPVYSKDMTQIFFSRQEERSYSIWSYNFKNNFLASLSTGTNPCTISNNTFLCVRQGATGRGEIWRVNVENGVEECVVSDTEKSFSSPSISPNGRYIVMWCSLRIMQQMTCLQRGVKMENTSILSHKEAALRLPQTFGEWHSIIFNIDNQI